MFSYSHPWRSKVASPRLQISNLLAQGPSHHLPLTYYGSLTRFSAYLGKSYAIALNQKGDA
jgi:hypothetical protein